MRGIIVDFREATIRGTCVQIGRIHVVGVQLTRDVEAHVEKSLPFPLVVNPFDPATLADPAPGWRAALRTPCVDDLTTGTQPLTRAPLTC